jgi:hypothetical protein
MPRFVGALLSSCFRKFNLHHKDLIHIEGGLGSQILGAIAFWNLQNNLGEAKAKCDLSYFSNEASTNQLWAYELEKFNLPLAEFEKFESRSKGNLLKAKRDFLTDDELAHDYWEISRSRYLSKFSYDRNKVFSYFQESTKLKLEEPFTAIHIRRGDYLKVASKIVSVEDYLEIVNVVGSLASRKVVVICDSELSDEDKSRLQKALDVNELIFLDSPGLDPFNIHCLLREAKLLITGNSTYSFSAGLLGRQGQIVFSPMQFHKGVGSEKYNRSFRAAGLFFAWPKRS